MSTIAATARRWEHGWELYFGDDEVTQVRTLDKAAQQVIDYLDTIDPDTDHSGWAVNVTPELGEITKRVQHAREATAAAARAQAEAAAEARAAARALRAEGLSVTDTAAVLGVSRGRVSQLAA